jgi:hypothetical protein
VHGYQGDRLSTPARPTVRLNHARQRLPDPSRR